MGTVANGEDPDEFHQGLHYFLRQINHQRKQYKIVLKIIICDPLIYIINHPDLTVCSFMENSIGLKRVKFYKDYKLFVKAKTCFLFLGNILCCFKGRHQLVRQV